MEWSNRKITLEEVALAAEEYQIELKRINGASLLPLDDPQKLKHLIDEYLSERIAERLLMSKFGRGFVIGYIGGIRAIKMAADGEFDE